MSQLGESAQLAMDTLLQKPVQGVPPFWVNIMEHSVIERLAGAQPGEYVASPERVYLASQRGLGICAIDQWIPENPLMMGAQGFEDRERTATTGAERIVRDGVVIDSPESVVEHLENFAFPSLRKRIAEFDEEKRVREIIDRERAVQALFGPDILKTGHEFVSYPYLEYWRYGYEAYFMAYALYPELMEKHFALQADLALLNNTASARAYREANLPILYRLDHDMADSRGMLVNIVSLDRIWFPHFARCLQPMLKTGVRLLWHCDGNLMQMVPRLLEVGFSGFQGFQYEDGMDYEKICRMKTKDGRSLIVVAGVSVTRTLPHGSPDDVRREMRWLVDQGPRTGLFLSASSSVAPGVPWDNIRVFADGLKYYRTHGRG